MTSIATKIIRRIEGRVRLTRYATSADCFLVSYPKSGRTWLRYMLASYFASLDGRAEPIDLFNMFTMLPNFALDAERGIPAFFAGRGGPVPRVWVSHHNFRRSLFFHKPVIMMIRDPRDVIVSGYFHAVRHKHRFEGTMADFIKDESQGLPEMCRYLNGWAKGIENRRHNVLSYESLSADTEQGLRSTLEFLNCPIDVAALKAAVLAGNFAAMQDLEVKEGLPAHEYDRSDNESLRMRRGQAGGFRDYLDDAMLETVREICARGLSPKARTLFARSGLTLA